MTSPRLSPAAACSDSYAGLGLDPPAWTVERADTPQRTATGPGGPTAVVTGDVLLIRRAGG
ncbi:hypothetical protein [Amycolatopsis rubida]|uniref:Uncharacterized protein n=1 Tax=Amycolatopsis rubida TaxID=112413 RepID=A0A1I5SMW2_9PSEU|nr:hypothetical protein [Amycolatopsis rubida]SFP72059.1 hypothetical protein SAMN05421854_106384 [Amycolatopsis rubida]